MRSEGEAAIARVRAAGITDCEAAASRLKTVELPGGDVYNIQFKGDLVGNHAAYYRGGTWYDSTGYNWAVSHNFWTNEQLAAKGLLDAAQKGVFTPQQYEQFLEPFGEMPTIPPGH